MLKMDVFQYIYNFYVSYRKELARVSICFTFAGLSACDTGLDNNNADVREESSTFQLSASQLLFFQQELKLLSNALESAEGIAAVKRLQWAYGHYSETGLWNDFADLFSDHAIGHYPAGDLDRDAIRDLFVNEVGEGRLGLAEGRIYPHISFTPVITMAPGGQSAKARFRILAMLGGYGGNAIWAHGLYENSYIKEDGVWKVSELGYHGQVSGVYGENLQTTLSAPISEPTVPFHYDVEQIGKPSLLAEEAAGHENNSVIEKEEVSALLARLQSLEHGVVQLEAENQVVNLQHSYGYYSDDKLWNETADLFADNGTMELGLGGVYVGKESIRHALNQFGSAGLKDGELNDQIHFQTYTSVAPDGHTAKVRGTKLGMIGVKGESSEWHEGIYENTYVNEEGVWKIQSVHDYPRLVTDYDQGWAKHAGTIPGENVGFPADQAPSEVYEIYPKPFIPEFHFRNPVTDKIVQYPNSATAVNTIVGFADVEDGGSVIAIESMEQLALRLDKLKGKLDMIKAYHSTENIINAYSYYMDEHMWSDAAKLFAKNGWNKLPSTDAQVGSENIKQSLLIQYGKEQRQAGNLTLNHMIQPVIKVAPDGQSADIRVRLWQVHVQENAEDYYMAGIYEAKTVKENGIWKISAMDLNYTWQASYLDGWASADLK